MAGKWKVWAECTTYAYLEVEADSKEEALRIAGETDGGDFTPNEEGDWEITEAEEI